MFTYTNTVVINSDTDELSGLVKFEGKTINLELRELGDLIKILLNIFPKEKDIKES